MEIADVNPPVKIHSVSYAHTKSVLKMKLAYAQMVTLDLVTNAFCLESADALWQKSKQLLW